MKHLKTSRAILIIFCSLFAVLSNAQSNCKTDYYEPSNESIIASLNIKKKQRQQKIDAPKNAVRALLRSYYESFENYLLSKDVVFDSSLTATLQNIVSQVSTSNPELPINQYTFFYDTKYIANAASFGDGSFIINAGLIEILENDDQLAFIICHEIAHELLQHGNKRIEQQLNKADSDKDISLFYKQSRNAEFEADSLGFELYKNTKYSQAEARKALLLLRNADSLLYNQKTNIESVFDFDDYAFKTYWLEKEERILTITKRIDDNLDIPLDSLRTHPDAELRAKKLSTISDKQINQDKNSYITELKDWQKAHYHCINRDKAEFDILLYRALVSYQLNETENEEAIIQIAQTLKDVYEAKRNHELGKYIRRPGPFELSGELNSVKRFIINTESGELKNIGFRFCKQFENKMNNKEFLDIYHFFKEQIN